MRILKIFWRNKVTSLPDGYSEAEVLAIIKKISGRLSHKFKFGYHELEDMKQQAALFAWEGLARYDGIRPLENFLWIHVRNRLFNFKRNNYGRPDKPCDNCPLDAYRNNECTAYNNMLDCEWYEQWFGRNQIKRDLMSTKEFKDKSNEGDLDIEDKVLGKELYTLIDQNMPVTMREDWVRFINKLKLTKNKREALMETIRAILIDNNIGI